MLETAVALVFAHVMADFVLQTEAMVRRKKELRVLLLHIAIVAVTSLARARPRAAAAAGGADRGHPPRDRRLQGRTACPTTLASFLADQAAHVIVLAAVAFAFPGAYALGLWATLGGPAGPALDGLPQGDGVRSPA